MTALAQGAAGLALVVCFALLGTGQLGVAIILLGVQSIAVALAALARHQPLLAAAIGMVDVLGATWFLHHRLTGGYSDTTPPIGGAKRGIAMGAGVAVLSQSCGALALPLAVLLLSILLAATRRHPLMRLIALVSVQNGIALAACQLPPSPMTALVGFALPLPFACFLLLGADHLPELPRSVLRWLGWGQLGISVLLVAGSLALTLDPFGALFTPLVGLVGVAEAWALRDRMDCDPVRRLAEVARQLAMMAAVAAPLPEPAWLLAVLAGAASLLPVLRRRWDVANLMFCAAGLALFGLLAIPSGFDVVSCSALFLGYAVVAAAIPDLAVVVVLLIGRLVIGAHLPLIGDTVLISVASLALVICAGLLAWRDDRNRVALLHLTQCAIAALALGIDAPETWSGAVILLVLLILTRCAERIAVGPSRLAAIAGLSGAPPFGVFPGLAVVVLAMSTQTPLLLIPVGLALAGTLVAGVPRRMPIWSRSAIISPGWLPLLLALAVGFFAPPSVVAWLHAASLGAP